MSRFNFFNVAAKLRDALQAYSPLTSLLATASKEIPINAYLPQDANRAPWVGVYLESAEIVPHTVPSGYKASPVLRVVAMSSDMRSAESCMERLQEMVEHITTAITERPKLGGAVDMIAGLGVDYTYIGEEQEGGFMQVAVINIRAEVSGHAID